VNEVEDTKKLTKADMMPELMMLGRGLKVAERHLAILALTSGGQFAEAPNGQGLRPSRQEAPMYLNEDEQSLLGAFKSLKQKNAESKVYRLNSSFTRLVGGKIASEALILGPIKSQYNR